MGLSTLAEILRRRALDQPDKRAYTFLADDNHADSLTYGELDRRARAIAALLQEAASAGEHALLCFPPGLDFISTLFGCFYSGVVAVPAYPPANLRHLTRLQAIAVDSQASLILTTRKTRDRVESWLSDTPGLSHLRLFVVDDGLDGDALWREFEPVPDSLALLQYTSGSTSEPRGVMISHANLRHNSASINEGFKHSSESVAVSWLPTFHDMGLVDGVLQPLYSGFPCYLMAPTSFLQKPLRWLEAISRYRATHSGGPNFSYALCVQKIGDEQCAGLDLSSWRIAYNGAEPVLAATLESFAQKFAAYGFRWNAFYPCYGLAEATLKVSGPLASGGPVLCSVDRNALGDRRVVEVAAEEDVAPLVGSGVVSSDSRVVIVNPEERTVCPPDEVGEIWFSSLSVARGYFNQNEASEATFNARLGDTGAGPFLRTGDLGFLRGNELFVVGRIKDVIIIRGRNHYPQDIEVTAQQAHPALTGGMSAAFGIAVDGEEQLVVVQEIGARGKFDYDEILDYVLDAVAAEHELFPHAIALVRRRSLPRTSSGKVQRHLCRKSFLAGTLETIAERRRAPHLSIDVSIGVSISAAEGFPDPLKTPQDWEQWLANLIARRVGQAIDDLDVPVVRYGIDSLVAAELTSAIQAQTSVNLPPAALLRRTSIRQLAGELRKLSKETESSAAEVIVHEEGSTFPLSYGQQSLWLVHQLAPQSAVNNVVFAARVVSALDRNALRDALQAVVDKHPTLRTTYAVVDGEPMQQIHPHLPLDFREVDLGEADDEQLKEALRHESRRHFDVQHEAPLGAVLFTRVQSAPVLLLVAHHLTVDAWSLEIVLKELAQFYSGTLATVEVPGLHYTDYARWQRETLGGPTGERLWNYWREQLSDHLPVLELPFQQGSRSLRQTHNGATLQQRIDAPLTRALQKLGRDHDTTLFTVLLSVFYVLLYRYTRQEDIVIGTPTAGRNREEVRDLVGYFVNPVLLRTNISGSDSFEQLLETVREVVLSAVEHQDYPFSLLIERLQPDRDMTRLSPLQVVFAFQNAHLIDASNFTPFVLGLEGGRLKLDKLALESIALDTGTAQFDLTLTAAQADDELICTWQYSTDIFEAESVERLLDHYVRLLAATAAAPQAAVRSLPLLSPTEREQIVVGWNASRLEVGEGASLTELFEAEAQRRPTAVAVRAGGEELSYGELNGRANQLAAHLRRQGVGAEKLVGVCVERSVEMVTALLAVLKAGSAYVPLDPGYPAERLRYMVEDAGVELVLWGQSESGSESSWAEWAGVKGIKLAECWAEVGQYSRADVACGVSGANLAYVIYTSGSTGRPKGVMVTHGNVTRLFAAVQPQFQFTAADVWTMFHSYAFDFSVWEMWGALLYGGKLVVAPYLVSRSPAEFWRLLAAEKVTVLNQTPSAFAELMRVAAEAGGNEQLRVVVFGGEALDYPGLRGWVSERGLGQTALVNMYGITETTVHVTYHRIEEQEVKAGRASVIGKPLADLQCYILDEWQEPVPVGVSGELYVGGAGLARGYLGRAEQTAERFVPDGLSGRAGARLYRTGDLGRYRSNGEIEYLGRLDQQVKLRGYRIELAEIAAVLKEQEGVADAVVLLQERGAGGEPELVGYYVPRAAAAVSSVELRTYLRGRLPDYMVPGQMVALAQLPLTANGKVDRAALLALAKEEAVGASEVVGPRTALEEAVSSVWRELLGRERVGVEENFFELGGHSLLATRLLSRVREVFGVELPLRSIFEQPTVSGLCRELTVRLGVAPSAAAAPLRRVPRGVGHQVPLALSFAQQRLWFLDQLEPGTTAYNIAGALRLRGQLRVGDLERALSEIVRRHEALRTRFAVVDGQAVQVIEAAAEVRLAVEQVGGETAAERAAELNRMAAVEAEHQFDLAAGGLLRLRLLRVVAEEHVLLLTMHHIIADGWSLGVLVRELGALYEAYGRRVEAGLPELAIQYVDYAVWQREWLQGAVLEEQLGYWREQLKGAGQVLELGSDRVRPAVRSYRGGAVGVVLDAELVRQLKELSGREAVTLYMVLLASWQALLWRYTGAAEISVGTPVANRGRSEIEGLIGFFVNTLVLRTAVRGGESFRELLQRVKEVCVGAYAHQDVPFERLVEELQPERDMSHTPLFQVMLDLQTSPLDQLQLPDLVVERYEVENATAKYDLTLSFVERAGELSGTAEYSTDIFEVESVERLLDHYVRLLAAAAAAPQAAVRSLPLLSPTEREQIVLGWNVSRLEVGEGASLTELFEAEVRRRPTAVAVRAGGEELSYGELNGRANQLAAHLRRQGVGAEKLVGVCVERSVGMVTALLAVLKAGSAYVPLDPGYPAERLRYMVEDAGVELVLWGQSESRSESSWAEWAGVKGIKLEECWAEVGQYSRADVACGVSGANLAYVIYTSGSTGRPKGVMVTHGNVTRLFAAVQPQFQFTAADVWTMFHSYAFDFSVWEMWGALLYGGKLVVAPYLVSRSPAEFWRLLAAEKVTVLNQTPSAFAELMRVAAEAGGNEQLRVVVFGGEALDYPGLRGWVSERGLGQTALVNMYGITETTVHVTYHRIEEQEVKAGRASVIGKPLADLQCYILDEWQEPVPVGVSGELYVGGAGLARGYLGRAEQTAERFVPDGLSGRAGARLYRTGDLGRYRSNGEIEYLGRLDQQVKLRGYRIELAEIAAVLKEQEGVADAVVLLQERGAGGEPELVGYYVPQAAAAVSSVELRTYLRGRLPDYMVPGQMVALAQLPLTANGKVDRAALLALAKEEAAGASEVVGPRTALEEAVSSVWRELLGRERVGIEENFFELGGHSLLATRLLSRMREVFGVDLPLRSIFEQPTIAHMASLIPQLQRELDEDRILSIHAFDGNGDTSHLDQLSDEEIDRLYEELVKTGEDE